MNDPGLLTTVAVPERRTADDPPSLRRQAPARIELTSKSGQVPRMDGKRVHIAAERIVVVKVAAQSRETKIEINVEPPLHSIIPATSVGAGRTSVYHAEFSGRISLRGIPVPQSGNLHIVTIDQELPPFCTTIPMTVWPSRKMLLFWWLLTVGTFAALRVRRLITDAQSLEDALAAIWSDFPDMLILGCLISVALVPLQFFGWLISLAMTGKSEE